MAGIVTFKTAEPIREAVRLVPDDRLLVETDAPFLAPVPFRGKRNEPAHVGLVAEKVAEVWGQPLEAEVAELTTANARRLFRLPAPPARAGRGRASAVPAAPLVLALAVDSPGWRRSAQRTTGQPRRSASSRKGSLGLTTTGWPTASKSGTSAGESE